MPTNEHYYERQVIRDPEYLETVEAAMMKCALDIFTEDPATAGHENRAATAKAVFIHPPDTERFARFFAWLALFDPAIRGQVFQPALPDKITPQNIDGIALQAVIKGAWNVISNVTV